jgi:hypothetical protein
VLILTVLVLIPVGTIATRWAEKHMFQRSAKVETTQPTRAAMPSSTQVAAEAEPPTTVPVLPVEPAPDVPMGYKVLLIAWQVGRFSLGILLMLATVAIIYYFGPNVKQKWRLLTPGAVFTVVVWVALGGAFRAYIDKYGKYDQTYGAVGGVAILLLFFYIDAVVLLIGAEINSEVDFVSLGLEPGATDFTGKPWANVPQPAPVTVSADTSVRGAAAR